MQGMSIKDIITPQPTNIMPIIYTYIGLGLHLISICQC